MNATFLNVAIAQHLDAIRNPLAANRKTLPALRRRLKQPEITEAELEARPPAYHAGNLLSTTFPPPDYAGPSKVVSINITIGSDLACYVYTLHFWTVQHTHAYIICQVTYGKTFFQHK